MKNNKLRQKRRKGKARKFNTFDMPNNAATQLFLSFYNIPVIR